MTTSLKNVSFDKEVLSFDAQPPVSSLKLAFALADLLQTNGPEFIATIRGQALLHTLIKASHGADYKIDGRKEQERLRKALLPATTQRVNKITV